MFLREQVPGDISMSNFQSIEYEAIHVPCFNPSGSERLCGSSRTDANMRSQQLELDKHSL